MYEEFQSFLHYLCFYEVSFKIFKGTMFTCQIINYITLSVRLFTQKEKNIRNIL